MKISDTDWNTAEEQRPRIVAGMTLGTVVVEADANSGALITANFATEYGRRFLPCPAGSIRRAAKAVTI